MKKRGVLRCLTWCLGALCTYGYAETEITRDETGVQLRRTVYEEAVKQVEDALGELPWFRSVHIGLCTENDPLSAVITIKADEESSRVFDRLVTHRRAVGGLMTVVHQKKLKAVPFCVLKF